MSKNLKKKWQVSKELEFEVEALDKREAEEITSQYIEIGLGTEVADSMDKLANVLDVSYCSQKTIKVEQI